MSWQDILKGSVVTDRHVGVEQVDTRPIVVDLKRIVGKRRQAMPVSLRHVHWVWVKGLVRRRNDDTPINVDKRMRSPSKQDQQHV